MTEVPICGHCGLPEKWHQPQDHLFDAVGGSLPGIDPMFKAADRPMPRSTKATVITGLSLLAWGAFALLAVAAIQFLRHLKGV